MNKKMVAGSGEAVYQKATAAIVALARLLRFGVSRLKIKTLNPRGSINQSQECARRRRFHERHHTASGGGPIWPK
jgi:hypothetical protein